MRVCAGGRRQEAGGGGIPLGEMNSRPVLALNEEKQTKNILRLTDATEQSCTGRDASENKLIEHL